MDKSKVSNKEKIGLDLVDNKPDYTKSLEENKEIQKERYEKIYKDS